jgi:hypothetical protein
VEIEKGTSHNQYLSTDRLILDTTMTNPLPTLTRYENYIFSRNLISNSTNTWIVYVGIRNGGSSTNE